MKRLRDLREDKNWTQVIMADILGCSQTTYSRYENGITDIPNDILDKLADLYSVSVDYILGRTDRKDPYEKSCKKDTVVL